MRLGISIALQRIILDTAARDPAEVCGLLLGRYDDNGALVTALLPTANVAADPARFFEIDPTALLRAHRAARAGGPTVIGHYHSHPNGRTDPSLRDAAAAAPDGSYWIIAAAGRLACWRASAAGALHGRFDAVDLACHESGAAGMERG